MKVVRLGKKEFREKFGDADAITTRGKGEESIVYTPGKASTHETLHEIYHAKESPDLSRIEEGEKWSTPDQVAIEELRAEKYASGKMGKELSGASILVAARVMKDEGYRPSTIMGSIKRGLEALGYQSMDREDRHNLWEYLRED